MIYVHLFLHQHRFAAMHFGNLDFMGCKWKGHITIRVPSIHQKGSPTALKVIWVLFCYLVPL